eukprot:GHVT01059910.1.p1 GENE.GHVT01059910.1~~GHVT01059910.1.p1  ORF type:complete len:570 (+),score=122.98 GHVT01059910.1:396-2105(+)
MEKPQHSTACPGSFAPFDHHSEPATATESSSWPSPAVTSSFVFGPDADCSGLSHSSRGPCKSSPMQFPPFVPKVDLNQMSSPKRQLDSVHQPPSFHPTPPPIELNESALDSTSEKHRPDQSSGRHEQHSATSVHTPSDWNFQMHAPDNQVGISVKDSNFMNRASFPLGEDETDSSWHLGKQTRRPSELQAAALGMISVSLEGGGQDGGSSASSPAQRPVVPFVTNSDTAGNTNGAHDKPPPLPAYCSSSSQSSSSSSSSSSASVDLLDKLKVRYASMKETSRLLKEALRERQQMVSSLEEKTSELQVQKRQDDETIDNLTFQQRQLMTQVAHLTDALTQLRAERSPSSASSSGWSGTAFSLLGGSGSNTGQLEDEKRREQELQVATDELEMKIKENEILHVQLFETRREHQQSLHELAAEIEQLKTSEQAVRDAGGVATAALEAQRLRIEAAEASHRRCAQQLETVEAEAARNRLQNTTALSRMAAVVNQQRATLRCRMPFDSCGTEALARYDVCERKVIEALVRYTQKRHVYVSHHNYQLYYGRTFSIRMQEDDDRLEGVANRHAIVD